MMFTKYVRQIVQIIERDWKLEYNAEIQPVYVVTNTTNTAAAGTCYYRATALDDDYTITSAFDLNNVAIAALAGRVIPKGQTLTVRLSKITFTDATCLVQLAVRNIND